MKLLLGSLAMVASATAFQFNIERLLTLNAMRTQFDRDSIDDPGQREQLMKHFTGASDLQLFMSRQMSADEFKTSMKQQMKDNMISQILAGGGIDLSNPIWRKQFFNDQDDSELFTESMPEPQQSIIRLVRSETTALAEYGRQLLKKYQFKQFNSEGNYLSQNFDYILLQEDNDSRKSAIKEVIQQSLLESIADPIDRAMMGILQKIRDPNTSDAEKLKLNIVIRDLQKIKVFEGSVPQVSPVSPDHLFTFYHMANGELQPADILNIALSEDNLLSEVSELDFERFFGSPAKQFSCRSHADEIKVPCGVDATAEECLAAGCCYHPSGAGVPSCFHDLYGKIGSGLLRTEFIASNDAAFGLKDRITDLFIEQGGVRQIPTLSQLLRDQFPAALRGVNNVGGEIEFEASQQAVSGVNNWWDSATVEGEPTNNGRPINAHVISNLDEERPRYGRPGYVWKAHGPTQSPYFGTMPGLNPTAAPGHDFGDLNQYYQMWLEYASAQDEAQCALINRESRIKCMENYEALEDATVSVAGASDCKRLGCCFNEDSFLEGSFACYRASDYGTCVNLPEDYLKKECGSEGVSEMECISNPRCCFEPSERREDPWCFYKYSATLDEAEWCTAWTYKENAYKQRAPCWTDMTTRGSSLFSMDANNDVSNINNLVSQEQCEAADCCFDNSRPLDAIEWLQQGLDQQSLFRCFKKENPALTAILAADAAHRPEYVVGDGAEINHNIDLETGNLLPVYNYLQKTCTVSSWNSPRLPSLGHVYKRSCGEGLSYFQCVYNERCCYQVSTSNEPTCYRPELDLVTKDYTNEQSVCAQYCMPGCEGVGDCPL